MLLKFVLLGVAVIAVLTQSWSVEDSPLAPMGDGDVVTSEPAVVPPAPPPRVVPAAGSGPRASVPRSSARLDLNRATLEQLQALPGIGETLARRVVHRREVQGRFRSVDDLLGVKGIGRKRLEQLRPWLMVSPQGTRKGAM